MFGIVAWFFILLIVTSLAVWVISWLTRGVDRIELHTSLAQIHDSDLNLWTWLLIFLHQLVKGEVKIIRLPQQEVESEDHEPRHEVLETLPKTSQTTRIQITVEIPANEIVHLEIKSQPGFDGEQEITVEAIPDHEIDQIPIALATSSPTLVQPLSETPPNLRKPGSINFTSRFTGFSNKISLSTVLFIISLGVYLFVRLVGLDQFPIYFFTDEAVHTVLAEDLVANHFRFNGTLLPTYFSLGASYGLNSVSVYLQLIPFMLFGKSVFVTRGISVLVTLLGAAAISLTLKDFFKAHYWWIGVLVLSTAPVWFFHSRTAFENIELAAFYAGFLYFYLCYRLRSPKWLFPAIISGALVFYTHGLGQFLMAASTGLLFIVDFPYHWKNKKYGLAGLVLIILLALPYIRFSRENPLVFQEQLRMRGTYWLDLGMSGFQKLERFGSEYLQGLNPLYWYIPNPPIDLARHQMKNYGYLLNITLPFFVIGLWQTIKFYRNPAYRTVLILLLVSPLGAAFAQITILRVIWFVIPATVMICLGLEWFLRWLETKRISRMVITMGVFLFLLTINLYLLQDALRNGPAWYKDYTLYGMQYGAKQVFGEAIPKILERDPNRQFVVTPTWANGTDNFVRFFLPLEQQQHVKLDSIQAYLFKRLPIDEKTTLVLTEPEYQEALASPKFSNIDVSQVINYPDGSPGFYFIHLEYSDQADAIFAAEKAARSIPVETTVQVDGQSVLLRYSQIDMGQPEAIFDGDIHTLMRGLEANPFIIEFEFPQPRSIRQINADLANMDFTMTATLYPEISNIPQVYETTQLNMPGNPHVEIPIDRGPQLVSRLRLEILSLNGGAEPHIHIREIELVE